MMSWCKIRKNIRILMAVLICSFFCMPVWTNAAETAGNDQRVYDGAGLFSDSWISSMEAEIAQLQKKMKMDVVVVTTQDAQGKRAVEYADDFYDYGGCGT